ncbi:tRNA dihydrouridine synthase DusB [Cetobacterium somerae]|uniref:tRNA dihydrouridine synthase DusB n=1 Tax=Cetobacterium sp. NK01 TaxID=2993530 RepID=UPI0021168383|nr:tRNA dihydrouridine synthase DusB [Cetobacterium sp. NK01]MCQ8212412.1 tRNA dihydrouridine synthase DusB [Cetobacterium sp. NK01]
MKIYIAPLAGVTDYTFRGILDDYKPDLMFTEMVSINALEMENEKTLNQILRIRDGEAVQIFGKDVEKMVYSAKYITEKLGVKHIDVNAGCPVNKIIKNGYGAALLEDPDHIKRILCEIREAIPENVDLSLKTRVGYKGEKQHKKVGKIAEEAGCKHITIHGRTREQMYSGHANWELIKEVKESVNIEVIGNGDIFTAEDAYEKVKYSGVDGIMLARGICGNPWLIKQIKEKFETGEVQTEVTPEMRLDMAIRHALQGKLDNPNKKFLFELRKHLCWYLKGIRNGAALKGAINQIENYDELIELLERAKENLK